MMIRLLLALGMVATGGTSSFAAQTILCTPEPGSQSMDTLSLQFTSNEITVTVKNAPPTSQPEVWTIESDPGLYTYYTVNKEEFRSATYPLHFMAIDVICRKKVTEIPAQTVFEIKITTEWWDNRTDDGDRLTQITYGCLKLY